MKQMSILIDEELFEAFYRTFPDRGARSAIIRKCIRALIRNREQITLESIVNKVAEEVSK